MPELRYICDTRRHLICLPYSVANLHAMAADLNIKRVWFHGKPGRYHYDIPKRRIDEITKRCKIVTTREILDIMQNNDEPLFRFAA